MRRMILGAALCAVAGCGDGTDANGEGSGANKNENAASHTFNSEHGTVEATTKDGVSRVVVRTKDGKEATLDVKDGEMTATSEGQKVTVGTKGGVADMKVAEYPGSRLNEESIATLDMPGMRQFSATLHTDDPMDKIVAFYKEQIGAKAQTMELSEIATIAGELADGAMVSVSVTQGERGGHDILVSTTVKK